MTGVVLADDSVLLRAGLERLLAAEGFTVLASLPDTGVLLSTVEATRPDIVVLDIRMPPAYADEGLRAAQALRRDHPTLAILLLSQYVETRDVLALLRQRGGGIGYLLKDRITDIDRFLDDVRRVAAGGTAVDPLVVARALDRPRPPGHDLDALSDREREILGRMAAGHSNAGIAALLFLGERTVEAHIRSIFAKLGIPAERDVNRRVLAVLSYLRT
ncbi:response regulator transcription factor [Hamadaea tsunoensis]|uniref:response regulator transcription factor n=1 Tax=Hamadaea tsunoensis TaxID=53368 RepID=UPI00040BCB64|nr:response regulator transcription factor [Hamadaea tsunoensis]